MHVALYERIWLAFAAVILIVFLGVASIGTFATGRMLPGHAEMVNPDTVTQEDPRFAQPRIEEVSPGVYNAFLVARMFFFLPQEIKVPAGSQVNFYVTSPDVIHGFEIAGTNVNTTVIPGYVTRVTAKFTRPGEYLILCNEYCGVGHHVMSTRLYVE
jgi:cytochrome c oxidase subunit 2